MRAKGTVLPLDGIRRVRSKRTLRPSSWCTKSRRLAAEAAVTYPVAIPVRAAMDLLLAIRRLHSKRTLPSSVPGLGMMDSRGLL